MNPTKIICFFGGWGFFRFTGENFGWVFVKTQVLLRKNQQAGAKLLSNPSASWALVLLPRVQGQTLHCRVERQGHARECALRTEVFPASSLRAVTRERERGRVWVKGGPGHETPSWPLCRWGPRKGCSEELARADVWGGLPSLDTLTYSPWRRGFVILILKLTWRVNRNLQKTSRTQLDLFVQTVKTSIPITWSWSPRKTRPFCKGQVLGISSLRPVWTEHTLLHSRS